MFRELLNELLSSPAFNCLPYVITVNANEEHLVASIIDELQDALH